MHLESGYHLVPDFVLAFIVSALSRWLAVRVAVWFVVPPVVSFVALGPENFSDMADEGGLIYLPFAQSVILGLLVSAVGSMLGYWLRVALKLKA